MNITGWACPSVIFMEDELFQKNTITIVVSHDNEWNDYVDQIVKL